MAANRCKLAVLASGRGSNFEAIAQACSKDDFPVEVACLITDNQSAGAVKIAERMNIPWRFVEPGEKRGRLRPGAEQEIVDLCEAAGVELVFLAGFMRILKGPLLERYPQRILNVHPSLLPSFKGLEGQIIHAGIIQFNRTASTRLRYRFQTSFSSLEYSQP